MTSARTIQISRPSPTLEGRQQATSTVRTCVASSLLHKRLRLKALYLTLACPSRIQAFTSSITLPTNRASLKRDPLHDESQILLFYYEPQTEADRSSTPGNLHRTALALCVFGVAWSLSMASSNRVAVAASKLAQVATSTSGLFSLWFKLLLWEHFLLLVHLHS